MERIEEKVEVSPFEQVKALPMGQRIVFLLQQLDRLQKGNRAKCHPIPLTKKMEFENVSRNASIKAYQETSQFVTALFGDELRDLLIPKKEDLH